MTPLIDWLRRRRNDQHRCFECRNCGTTLERADEPCPACGADEIHEYHLE
jgi:rubrerythrin